MPSQPIPVSDANEMIQAYITYMQQHSIDMDYQTHCVSFNFHELKKWLEEVEPYTDELRICFGLYPEGANAGRITTILWPYNNGQPATDGETEIEPYNDGDGHP